MESVHKYQGLTVSARHGNNLVQATDDKWRMADQYLSRLNHAYHGNESLDPLRIRVLDINQEAAVSTLQVWNGGGWDTVRHENHQEIVTTLQALKACLISDLPPLLDASPPLLRRSASADRVNQQLREEIGRLQVGQGRIQDELYNLQEELRGVRVQEGQKELQAKHLIEQLKDKESEIRRLQEQLDQSQKQAERYRKVSDERDEAVRQQQDLTKQLREMGRSLEQLRQSEQDNYDKIKHLQQQLEKQTDRAKQLQKANGQLSEQSQELGERSRKLSQEAANLRQELEQRACEYQDRMRELESSLNNLGQLYDHERREGAQKLEESQRRTHDLECQKRAMEEKVLEMEGLVKQYKQRLDEVEELKQRLHDAQEELEQIRLSEQERRASSHVFEMIDKAKDRVQRAMGQLVQVSRTADHQNGKRLVIDSDLQKYDKLQDKGIHQLKKMVRELVEMLQFGRDHIKTQNRTIEANIRKAIDKHPDLKDTFGRTN